MKRLSSSSDVSEASLSSHLFLCISRNKDIGGSPVINTRLVDVMNQPIYIIDRSAKDSEPTLRHCYTVDSIDQANSMLGSNVIKEMPRPIQFSESMEDYMWNPTMSLLPVGIDAMTHILEKQEKRFPKELVNTSDNIRMEAIKNSLEVGAYKSCIDCSYALPAYSRITGKVGMMLPLLVPVLCGQVPVAALLLNKCAVGYYLSTVLTIEMATRSVRMFRDPAYTWLREAL